MGRWVVIIRRGVIVISCTLRALRMLRGNGIHAGELTHMMSYDIFYEAINQLILSQNQSRPPHPTSPDSTRIYRPFSRLPLRLLPLLPL